MPEESARGTGGNDNVKVVVSATHVDLVKPADREDTRYLILKKVLRTAASSSGTGSHSDYKEALPQLVQVLQESTPTDLNPTQIKNRRSVSSGWLLERPDLTYRKSRMVEGRSVSAMGSSLIYEATQHWG